MARTIGIRAGEIILERHGAEEVVNSDAVFKETSTLKKLVSPGDVGAILAAAALSHDLGNPPFGHSGEQAVRHWFKTSELLGPTRKILSKAQRADFENWEGNAQGFRILTRLQLYKKDGGGMRLTHSSLAAFCKYTTLSLGMDQRSARASLHKLGVFQSEKEEFAIVARECGLLTNSNTKNEAWVRHPLAFLLEAADDICYRIIDLEDGVRSGCIPLEKAEAILTKIASKIDPLRFAKIQDKTDRIAYLRASSIAALIDQVVEAFGKHEPEMLSGRFDEALTTKIRSSADLTKIENLMCEHVYANRRVLEVEAAGFQIIPGLMDMFWCAVTYGQTNSRSPQTQRARKIFQLVPAEFRGPPGRSRAATYQRMMLIADYVTGMTDSYALSLFRKLHGIALPN